MDSDLERIAQQLVEGLDEMSRVVAHLMQTAHRCRENAAMVGALGARMPAQYLDAAASACEQAADLADRAAPPARKWAIKAVGNRSSGRPGYKPQLLPDEQPAPPDERDAQRRSEPPTEIELQLDLTDIGAGKQDPAGGAVGKDAATKDSKKVPAAREHGEPRTQDIKDLSSKDPDHRELLDNPPPNATIRVDDKFVYTTDDAGRVITAEAELDEIDLTHPRDTTAQRKLAGKLPGDHAGHIFARIFLGPLGTLNLLPMAGRSVNLSLYKTLENHWRRIIEDGRTVHVYVRFRFPEASIRPDTIWVEFMDGDTLISRRIRNDAISPKGS